MEILKKTFLFVVVMLSSLSGFSQIIPVDLDKVNVSIYTEVLDNGQVIDYPIGSGFFFTGERWVYLVTAKHVIKDLIKKNAVLRAFFNTTAAPPIKSSFTVTLSAQNINKTIFMSEKDDIALLRLFRFPDGKHYFLVPGVDFQHRDNLPRANLIVATKENSLLFEDVMVTDDVFFSGFPSSLNNYKELSNLNYSTDLVLFRRGIIANKNIGTGKLIVDGMVFPGNSGGPVFVNRLEGEGRDKRFYLVGLLIENVPYNTISKDEHGVPTSVNIQNSGYSIAEPVDGVLSLIDVAEKSN